MPDPTVSLIIPVRNGGALFRRCLAAVAASTVGPSELIVVDDGSTDDTLEQARAAGAIVLHTGASGSGPAVGRNLAAGHARGDLLFFCDADVEIRPDTIAHIQRVFADDPSLSALFGSYDDQPADSGFLSQYKNLFHHYVHQHGSEDASTFWSGCGAMRRDRFLEHGGFSPRYRLPSIEDIELGYTLKRAGHRIRLDKALLVRHLKRWTVGSLLHSDILARGIPWTLLILREQVFLNDLNLQTHNRVSVVALYLGLLCALAGLWQPAWWLGVPAAALALLGLNRHLYRFFREKRGVWFAARSVVPHWLYYFYNGLSFAIGALLYVTEPVPRASHRSAAEKRRFGLAAAGVLLLAALLRFHDLGAQSMWLDELLEIDLSRRPVAEIASSTLTFGAMPLDYFVTHLALRLGEQDFWLRAAPALWSLLAVAVLYRLAGRLLGRGTGLAAALCLSVSAFHVRYAQEMRPYALFGLLSLLSFYFLFRALRTNRGRHWLGYTVATACCLFSHYFALFVMAGQAVMAVIWLAGSMPGALALKRLLRFGVALAAVTLTLTATPSFDSVVGVGQVFAQGLAHPDSFSAPPTAKPNQAQGPTIDRAFFEDQLLRVLSGGGAWQWLFLAMVVAGAAAGLRYRPRVTLALLAWAVLPAVLSVLFLVHRGTFFAVRYVTPSFFALVIALALGQTLLGSALARRLPRWQVPLWAVLVIVPCLLSLTRVQAHYQTPKEDWRTAGQLIEANAVPGDKVDAPILGSALAHYAARPEAGRIDTTSLEVLDAIQERLWVVTHPYLGTAQGGLQDWLAAQPSTVSYPIDDALSVYVVDNSRTRLELLDSITPIERAITLAALADQYAAAESPAMADSLYRRALRLDGAPRYRVAYGNFLRRAGRAGEASQSYLEALAADPAQPGALIGLGRLYFERGLTREAVTALEAGAALAPSDYAANYFLWKSHERLGNADQAAAYLDRAAQIVPDLIEPP